MFGILFIYLVWKEFAKLAEMYQKKKWVYGLAGIASYYIGMFLFGIVFGIFTAYFYPEEFESYSDLQIGLMSIPVGLLVCWGFYRYLKAKWRKPVDGVADNLLDGDVAE